MNGCDEDCAEEKRPHLFAFRGDSLLLRNSASYSIMHNHPLRYFFELHLILLEWVVISTANMEGYNQTYAILASDRPTSTHEVLLRYGNWNNSSQVQFSDFNIATHSLIGSTRAGSGCIDNCIENLLARSSADDCMLRHLYILRGPAWRGSARSAGRKILRTCQNGQGLLLAHYTVKLKINGEYYSS